MPLDSWMANKSNYVNIYRHNFAKNKNFRPLFLGFGRIENIEYSEVRALILVLLLLGAKIYSSPPKLVKIQKKKLFFPPNNSINSF